MRKVLLQIDSSLDGFAAGPGGETDWVTADEQMNRDALALLDTADTLLLGRVAYRDFVQYWPSADTRGAGVASQIAQRINQATKVVFSRTLESVGWGEWGNAQLERREIGEAIQDLRRQPGKNMILYAGASIAASFIQRGLVDEYHLRVHPVIVGGGAPIFAGAPARRPLTLIESRTYQSGGVLLHYRPGQG